MIVCTQSRVRSDLSAHEFCSCKFGSVIFDRNILQVTENECFVAWLAEKYIKRPRLHDKHQRTLAQHPIRVSAKKLNNEIMNVQLL